MNGRGSNVRVRARRDAILAVLLAADRPLTHREVVDRLRSRSFSAVYADLRALCHSPGRPYASMHGPVNDPDYPVIWNSWAGVNTVSFELTPEARAELSDGIDDLEALYAAEHHHGGDQ